MKIITFIFNIILLIVLYAIIFVCCYLGLLLAMLILKWMGLGASKLSLWIAQKRSDKVNNIFNAKVVG